MKKIAAILAGLMLMAVSTAWAQPLTLSFTDGTFDPIKVVDGDVPDLNPQANAVSYIGKVGKSWFSISSGLYGAALGNGISEMLLSSVDIRTVGEPLSDLVIGLSRSAGEWSGTGAIAQAYGAITGGSATFTTKVEGNVVSNLTFPNGGVPFGGKESFTFSPEPEDVIELLAYIHPTGSGTTAFNYSLTPVPESSTVMLLGLGFLGLAIYTKRRSNS